MSSRYYSEMKEKKVSGGKKYSPPKAGRNSMPAKGGPDRSAGVPRKGSMGPFNVKVEGFSG